MINVKKVITFQFQAVTLQIKEIAYILWQPRS